MKDSFVYAYKTTDDDLKKKEILYHGTTAVTCFIREVEDDQGNKSRRFYSANCGDARVVLIEV